MKYQVVHIFDEVYRTNIYYLPKSNCLVLSDFTKRQFGAEEEEKSGYDGRTLGYRKDGVVSYVIAMAETNKTPKRLSQLAHECLHASLYILEDHGVQYDGDNSEQLTYHVQWLFRKCLEKKQVFEYDTKN